MHNNQAVILKVLQNREMCGENVTLEKKLPEFLIINAKKKGNFKFDMEVKHY
jgi:hypothetical protein